MQLEKNGKTKMKRITMLFTEENHEYLKQLAEKHYRRTSAELNKILQDMRDNILTYNSIPKEIDGRQIESIRLSNTSTTTPPTPEEIAKQKKDHFYELCKRYLGKDCPKDITELDEYLTLDPDTSYYSYAEDEEDTYIKLVYTMPEEKQIEYIEELKHYL